MADMQRQEYGAKIDTSGDDKLQTTGKLAMIQAGADTGGSNGPTGSSRSYPKGSGVSLKADFNPMKSGVSGYAVAGVGAGPGSDPAR